MCNGKRILKWNIGDLNFRIFGGVCFFPYIAYRYFPAKGEFQ